MKKESTLASVPRAARADAQRNRDAILVAARAVFEEEGVLASLDGIATRAGVGNATLYRNFPARNHLLAAVMVANLASMLLIAKELADLPDARKALGEWLFLLTWEFRIWHDLPHCIASAQTDADSSMKSLNTQLMEATAHLLDKARSAGVALATLTANDLFELVTTLSWGVDRFGDDEQAARRRVAFATAGVFLSTDPC